ncbi:MAG TPA: TRAP transporter small permease subunit [Steroidobacteraceae bacterium]|nr:TRAP transporter small permease subunit [Steroidobacteraceae bacterium]
MPGFIRAYVRAVDAVNRTLGFAVMYMTLVMMGVLLYGTIVRLIPDVAPPIWVIEMSQFLMAAYYLLGGGYSMQLDAHVRMDVFYGRWSERSRAFADSITAFCLVFYLIVMIRGGISSASYALQYGQKNYSAWAPPMAPIKIIMTVGIVLMLLQAIAIFFRDLARATKRDIE